MKPEKHRSAGELHRLGSELLGEGLTVRIQASGYSMFPAIRPGDIIEIMPLAGDAGDMAGVTSLVPGEIIALRREDDFVVHRLVGSFERDGRRWVFTRGDSVMRADAPSPAKDVAGKVVTIIRRRKVWLNPLPRKNVLYRWNRLMVLVVHALCAL